MPHLHHLALHAEIREMQSMNPTTTKTSPVQTYSRKTTSLVCWFQGLRVAEVPMPSIDNH